MATEKQGPLEVEKAEVPSSPGQAARNQADPRQPPSTKPLGADPPPVSDTAYKFDEDSSNTESELPILLFFICHVCLHNNQGFGKNTLITRLKLAIGLSVRPSNTTNKYRISSNTKSREIRRGWAMGDVLIRRSSK